MRIDHKRLSRLSPKRLASGWGKAKFFYSSWNRSLGGTDHNQTPPTRRARRKTRLLGGLMPTDRRGQPGIFIHQTPKEIAMKYALLAAGLAAFTSGFCVTSAPGMDERREAPVAAAKLAQGPRGLGTSDTPQTSQPAVPSAGAPETVGHSADRRATSSSSQEELRSAAEARRVRDAVRRTLDRAHALSRAESD